MSKAKGPVCRNKLVLLYICSLLLAETYAPEPNPGPRNFTFPCGVCNKACKWTTCVCCDSCEVWYHQECMGMPDAVFKTLHNVSWECVQCGLPNFSTGIFDNFIFDTSNSYQWLSDSTQADSDISFNNPTATSTPHKQRSTSTTHGPTGIRTDLPMRILNIENISVISGLQPDRLIKHYVSDDACRAEVVFPGLWYTDFDRKIGGKWMLSSIVKTFEAIGFVVLPIGFINCSILRDRNHSFFMAGAVYNFSQGIHQLNSKTHWGPLFPIRARISLSHVGTSSFTMDIVLRNDNTGEQLASCVSRFVYVDFITRKPSPFPSWFLEYQKNVDKSLNITVEKPKLLKIPENCFTFTLRAYFSDTDSNEHVTQSTYVRWCSDVGSFAATSGYYRNFREDIGVYPLANLETHYLGEMQAEDRAVVHTWQDETNFRELYFCVTNSSKPVFQAHFHFTNDIPFESSFVKSKI